MRKRVFQLLILHSVFVLLFACSNNGQNNQTTSLSTNETEHSEEVPSNAVRITITIEDGSQFINEQQLEIEENANLLEILEDTFFVETNAEDEITSIERMRIDEDGEKSWNLFINDKAIHIPAKDYSLSGGERVVFDLQ